ncbi:MAG: hypothetical protein WDO18_12525 [Acidobacteriota bacterium]
MQKLLLFAALALLYLSNLGGTGFLGPDEPRYASIGREMARTGDWITRIWMANPGSRSRRCFIGRTHWHIWFVKK